MGAGAVLAAASVLFGLQSEIAEGETQDFDEGLLLALRDPRDVSNPIGPRWVEEMGRDFTALGGTAVQMLALAMVSGYLALRRKFRTVGWLLFTILGGQAVTSGLKAVFSRPRPNLVPHGSYVYTSSFPSGHSTMAAITFLTLAVFLIRLQPSLAVRSYVVVSAVLLTVLVGGSRVYLGVHYPTDVIAGWAVGGAWATLCAVLSPFLERTGKIDPAAPGA